MHPDIELTPRGRLLHRRQLETPTGLRENAYDITDEAQHWLDQSVALQAGTCLSAVFELLKANAALRDLYKHDWADDYVARYEAIRTGQVVPEVQEEANAKEPAIAALVLSLHQEMRLPGRLMTLIAEARANKVSDTARYLNLKDGREGSAASRSAPVIKDVSRYWHISGRSVPFLEDTELWGTHYKAGACIHYSVSFGFDQSIHLPLCIGAGSVTLTISGQRRKERLTVDVPLGTDQEPPSITLHELIGAITHEFSFHGGPQETRAEEETLRRVIEERADESHAEDLTFGLARLTCPEDNLHCREANAQALQNRAKYWDLALVIEHTGWRAAEIEKRSRQGRVLELRALATDKQPRQTAYPAEQFFPGFDAEFLRYINWVASVSCSDWATHRFLSEWHTQGPRGKAINGWAVLALPDVPLSHTPITDDRLKGFGSLNAPLRPLFAPESPKYALVEAFEAFATQRRLDYEMRDDLEDED